ncbi:MAG: mechanosensitive ion channel family protein [Alphaproteobacteria bacterium]|nr:mechanosensitive ion channel family protein [Alphaproteobacteria bacterium]
MVKCFSKFLTVLFIGIFCLGSTGYAASKNAKAPTTTEIAETIGINIDFTGINEKIGKIQNNLGKEKISKEKIDEYISYLTQTDAQIAASRKDLDKQHKFIQKQLDALGEGPKDGEIEDIAITKQREALSQELATLDRIIKEADLLVIKIEDLNVQTLNARNQKTYGDLITKQSAFINPIVFFNGMKSSVIFFWDLVKSPIDWYNTLPEEQRAMSLFNIISMFFILMVALILAIMLRKFILRNWGYKDDIAQPKFNRKVVAAFAVAIARGVIFAFLIAGCMLWMTSTQIFANSLLYTLLMAIGFASLLAIAEGTISRVTFAPNYPQWRLINISTEKASRFMRMIYAFILFNTLAGIPILVTMQAQYPISTVHFVMIIGCAVKAFFLMWFAQIVFNTYKDKDENSENNSENEDPEEVSSDFKVIVVTNLLCLGIFALSLFGYPELSLFILNHIIGTLILCGLFEILRRSLAEITKKLILSGPWMKSIRSSKKYVDKIDFWLHAVITPTLVLFLMFTLLNFWGLPADFILQAFKKLLFGFKIGGMQISLIAIAVGIAVFFGSLKIFKLIRNKVAENVLAKIDMDDGIKHSLISGFSFVGFIISSLLAVIAIGVDLTNLAFIAGALSVGIGFGLQDVIKNLVAGIIILFERPLRVGDWVNIDGTEGTVKQINIRSTEIQSFARTSVIIPNATLISSSVTNLTHGDNMSRQVVRVGVAYGSDVEKVREILLECAAKNPLVLKNPAPMVLFQDFGSSSLDFELRCYVNDIRKGWTVPSELRFAINKRFIEEGIEIPFPQVVVHKGE